MNWTTTDQVKQAAEQGEIPALECSWEHHHQGETATLRELIDAIEDKKFDVSDTFCASCQFAYHREDTDSKCDKCLLSEGGCCGDSWFVVSQSFLIFSKDYSNANFKAFQEKEAEVCTYIAGVLEKKRAEKNTKSAKAKQKLEDHQKTGQGQCATCKHDTEMPDRCRNSNRKFCDCSGWEPKEDKPELDYSKPIVATKNDGSSPMLLLIPYHADNNYRIIGYDWVKLSNGTLNSCCGFKTREDAIKAYGDYDIRNHIFDDLARNAEDLDWISIKGSGKSTPSKIEIQIEQDSCISIKTSNSDGEYGYKWFWSTLDEATEVAYAILQQVATARRKQGKE